MNQTILDAVIILLAGCVVAVAVFRRFRLPPILAYLFVGMVVGPYGLAWIPHTEDTHFLAEFGVVFLLFTVGLEFSLAQFIAMKKAVLGLGGAQVIFTVLVTGTLAWLLGMPPEGAFVLGGVLAMSSTAIVTKQLTEQQELDSRHGRLSVAILLFQDIAVVPFLILIPAMSSDTDISAVQELGWALFKGVLVVSLMIAAGRWLLRPLFRQIAAFGSSELFTLTALLFALAAAWVTSFSGLSLVLGAFIAGMMLGETEFRHQLEVDIRPFRDVLLGFFFVIIGMMLDIHALPGIAHWVLLLVIAIVLFKTLSIMGLGMLIGASRSVAMRTGVILAQGGEFGLVLITLALREGLLDTQLVQVMLATLIISMGLTPILVSYNGNIAKRLWSGSHSHNREKIIESVATDAKHLSEHVIICGYGRIGQNLAGFLKQEGIDYVALDRDPIRVRDARAAGERATYGDSTHQGILKAVGLERAKTLVICYDEVHETLKILAQVRAMRPDIPILVRTQDDSNLDRLQQAGATEVVPETLEASLMLVFHLLLLLDVPAERIVRRVRNVHKDRYRMLRGFFHGQELDPLEESATFRERLGTVTLPAPAYAVGRKLDQLKLKDAGVMVTAVRRGGLRTLHPAPDMELQEGDTLVLYGSPEDLEHVEAILLRG